MEENKRLGREESMRAGGRLRRVFGEDLSVVADTCALAPAEERERDRKREGGTDTCVLALERKRVRGGDGETEGRERLPDMCAYIPPPPPPLSWACVCAREKERGGRRGENERERERERGRGRGRGREGGREREREREGEREREREGGRDIAGSLPAGRLRSPFKIIIINFVYYFYIIYILISVRACRLVARRPPLVTCTSPAFPTGPAGFQL